MAIDIRANVTCSLGELVSGSLSDSYIQGNGLVKVKGQCELVGLHTPAAGTAVTFSYTREGTTRNVPRRLRVLSSFADPFRNITKVELGCLLTYMEGVGPTPTVDGQASIVTGRQQQCLNGYTDYPADSKVPIPISAAGVMNTCLTRLGITASSNPLTNVFMVDEFDLSAGYVSVLGDLLVSESYFGYLDESETLQVRDLAVEGGGGPVLDANAVIDVDQIGVGELPGDAVVVRFDALKLTKEPDLNDAQAQRKRDWEEEEIIGTPERHVVRYTDSTGATVENAYTYIPYQKTVITYGPNKAWDPTTCVLASAHAEGADLSDSPMRSVTTERILSAEAAGNYYGQILSAGAAVDPSTVFEFQSKETEYKYDEKGELVETIVNSYEPMLKWAGGLDLNFIYSTATGTEWVALGTAAVLVEKTITKNENIYAPTPAGTYIKPGDELVPVVEAQKVTTERYVNWALTPQGQQAIAQIKDETPFATAAACLGWLNANSRALVLADGQVQINRGRDIVQGQTRAKAADRVGGESGERGQTTAQLIYVAGGAGAQRTISMSMPHQSDDRYTKDGRILRGDAAAKALRYGRTQNRLLLGNRYGVNVQLHADRMPAHPYDPLYLSNGSLMVQYRANGANWAFSKDGVVASLDALFWGVAGGSGTSWVPVAPGVSTFPPLPAVDGNGDANVGAVVPPWNETAPLEGVTRTTALVEVSDYLHSALSETVDLITKTKYLIGTGLLLEQRSFQFTGYDATFKFTKGLLAEAGTFNLYGQESSDKGFYVIKADAATFEVTGGNAGKIQTFNPLVGGAATFNVTGFDAGRFLGKTIKGDAATFTVTGQDAGLAATRKLTSDAAAFTLTGMDATLKKKVVDPLGSNVSLLLHMQGANGSTSFPDSSIHNHAVTRVGSPVISTAQHPSFLMSAASFNGTTDYLQVADHAAFALGSNDWTIECWVRLNTVKDEVIIGQGAVAGPDLGFQLYYLTSNSGWTFISSSTGATGTPQIITDGTPQGLWRHVAVCRSGANIYGYLDGVLGKSWVASAIFDSTAPVLIGAQNGASKSRFLDGQLADIRVTNGVARYPGGTAFTPPSSQFPDP